MPVIHHATESTPIEPSPLAVELRDLQKHFGAVRALDSLSLEVKRGELLGIVGPDGAGKTTLFQVISGVMPCTAGSVLVLGQNPRAARLQIGYVTQTSSVYPELSIDDNLKYFAGIRGVSKEQFDLRRARYLQEVDLTLFSLRLARHLSGGMRQKLALCCALISNPALLLLDEPTTGLDPVSRREFWHLLSRLTDAGTSVILATPQFDEAEVCQRVAFMHAGKIRTTGRPQELRAGFSEHQDLETVFLSNMHITVQAEEALPPFPWSLSRAIPSDKPAVIARDVCRSFQSFEAVKNVSFDIAYGEIFGLLGANGAGKTTTIQMLCGLLAPSSGELCVGGIAIRGTGNGKLRQRMGYMSQKFSLYDDLSVIENLHFYSAAYSIPHGERKEKIEWALSICGLKAMKNDLVGRLPRGFRQRIAFASSILHEPHILFLDEPTSGIDPLARRNLWHVIRELAHNGTAIIVTTHFLNDAEYCDRLGFMSSGELVAQGTPDEMKRRAGEIVAIETGRTYDAFDVLSNAIDPAMISVLSASVHVQLPRMDSEARRKESIDRLAETLKAANVPIERIRIVAPSLEDAFVSIVHRRASP